MPPATERYSLYDLVLGENTYASSTAQHPGSARRMSGLIASLSGAIGRERRHPTFLAATLVGGAVVFLDEFNFFDSATKTFSKFFFAATATKLYKQKVGTDTNWVEVTEVGTLANIPVARSINNLYHFSDGVSSFIFNGSTWVADGFPIPLQAGEPEVGIASGLGTLSITTNRFYWWTWADELATRPHESTSSPKSIGTGAQTNVGIRFKPFVGAASATSASAVISRSRGGFITQHVGMKFYINSLDFGKILSLGVAGTKSTGTLTGTANPADGETVTIGTVVYRFKTALAAANDVLIGSDLERSFKNLRAAINAESGAGSLYHASTAPQNDVSATSTATTVVVTAKDVGTYTITTTETLTNGSWGAGTTTGGVNSTANLVANAPSTQTAQRFMIAPERATHWHLYASEEESSNIGFFLRSIAVATPEYTDQSGFVSQTGSIFTDTERPIRNDPPPPTLIMAVHKRRIFRRRETQRNFFLFTGYEEVLSQDAGAAEESVPGADADTLSDLVNETSYPDESDEVRAMVSHGDALYIGTEDEITPLYGESFDDFVLSNVAAFRIGMASRNAGISTPFGLAFFSTDRKVYLYPSSGAPSGDMTTRLIEIGRPKRNSFRLIKNADLINCWMVHYNWSERDWLVFCFQDNASVYHTWVFDFETKGWFELTLGVASLGVFEIADGSRVLIGGGSDGKVYVLDDLTGTYPGTGNFPVGTFRTALIDFGHPHLDHRAHYVEFEISDEAMTVDVNYWFDPIDIDAPGGSIPLVMAKTKLGANRFRGYFRASSGTVCHRLLIEFSVPASIVDGKLKGILIAAEPLDPEGTK